MSIAELAAVNRKSRAVLVLIACLSLGGCGGAWQPDRPDQKRPGVDGSGIYGPVTQDARIDL